MFNFQILVPFFNLRLIIYLTLQKLHIYVIKKQIFYSDFFEHCKMKKCYEIVISKCHDYTNKIAAEVCGKKAVSSRKRAHGMQGIFIVPSWNSLTFAGTLKVNLKKEGFFRMGIVYILAIIYNWIYFFLCMMSWKPAM